MTVRRRFPLRGIAGSLRGAGAVVAVATTVGALILTGRPVAGPLAAVAVAHHSVEGQRVVTVAAPDVRSSLALFGLTNRRAFPDAGEAARSHTRAPLRRWVRPNWGPLSSPFGMRWGRLHAGIDLAGPWGSTIVAATDGCISYAGPESGYGEVMEITDWDGTETVYGHMSSFIRRTGCIRAGTPIARVGAGGDATGAHLHFEVRVGGTPVNPIPFLARRGVYI